MTKKRALRLIMAKGVQRNEARYMLQIEHEKGKTNRAAVEWIENALEKADRFWAKIGEAAHAFGVSIEEMMKALKEMQREANNCARQRKAEGA